MNHGFPLNVPGCKRRGKQGKRRGRGREPSFIYRSRAGAACQNIPQWKDDTRPGSQRQAGFGPGPQQTGICSPARLVLGEATAEGKTGKGRGGARPALGSDPVWGKSIIDWLTGALTAHSRRKAETTSAKAKQEPSPARWEGLDFRPAELLLDSGFWLPVGLSRPFHSSIYTSDL